MEGTSEEPKPYILKPNIKRIFLFNLAKVLGFAFLLTLPILVLKFMDLLNVFLEIGKEYGIVISPAKFVLFFILYVIGAVVVLLLINYVTLGSVRYEFYPDRMEMYISIMFVLIDSKKIPYTNISRVSVDKSDVVIELSGMEKKEIRMTYIDNPGQIAQYIHKMVVDASSRFYANKVRDYRFSKVLDQEGF